MSHSYDRRIDVETLARVEGEGALHVHVEGGHVLQAELEIYEPPRFFEALLRGRAYTEPPDITARICGICPVAYQMSAVQAIEQACGVEVPRPILDLRRLLYCGEWIESHVLHMAMLHAPDFLGYDGAVEMARDHRQLVTDALRLRGVGNALLEVVGGRAVHPVNVKVGGFYRAPRPDELRRLLDDLVWARGAAADLTRTVSTFDFPALHVDVAFLALRSDRYPMESGRIVTTTGIDAPVEEFGTVVVEEHVPRSTALHARLADGADFLTGPLARYALNRDLLGPESRALADEVGLGEVEDNPFRSILVRGVETHEAISEAIRLIESYELPAAPAVNVPAQAGRGHGATEAPRGVLYHTYELDPEGSITDARIVPPTAQNQRAIERDLAALVETNLDLDDEALTWRCEQTIRNYDPCISCSTHFLRVEVHGR